MKPCEVKWCAALTAGRYCPIHAKNPPRRNEDANEWPIRLRAEDKAAKKAAENKALEEAHRP